MIDSPTRVISSSIERRSSRRKFDWKKLEGHLADVGALHASVYRLLRDLVPAAVLSLYWFWKHPGVMFHGSAWWYMPRVSLLQIGMLGLVTLLSRLTARAARRSNEELIHREISANLLAALISALLILPMLAARFGELRALRVAVGFFAASSGLSLALLAATCLIGWFSFETLIARREVLIVGSGPAAQAVFEELMDSPVYHVAGVLDDDFVGANASLQGMSTLATDMQDYYLGSLERLDGFLSHFDCVLRSAGEVNVYADSDGD
jgi:FlaA1/EpsC-like NDP-sugar epimerase